MRWNPVKCVPLRLVMATVVATALLFVVSALLIGANVLMEVWR